MTLDRIFNLIASVSASVMEDNAYISQGFVKVTLEVIHVKCPVPGRQELDRQQCIIAAVVKM